MRDSGRDPLQPTSDTTQTVWSQLAVHTQQCEPREESRGHFQSVFYFLVLCDFSGILDINKGFFFNSEITNMVGGLDPLQLSLELRFESLWSVEGMFL